MSEVEIESLKLENQISFPLYAAAREVMNLYTPYLQQLGITYTQYLVFTVLWEEDGVPVKNITEKLHLDTGTLTPLLQKMEKAGYVRKKRSRKDERVVKVFLTEKGKALQEEAARIPAAVGSSIPLEPEEERALYGLLNKLLAAKQ